MNKDKKIIIIGAGWYGCHIGLYLKRKGYNIKIFDKENDIFQGSSGYNQFRLHSGFHYPRSAETINEIKINYVRFAKYYKKFIHFPKINIYCIAKKKSLIDSKTYDILINAHKLKAKKKIFSFLENIDVAYNCNEGVLQNEKIKNFYKKELKKNIFLNKKVGSILNLKNKFDLVLDCTNNTLSSKKTVNNNFVLTISFIYKKNKNKKGYPITVMDGELPSIYPYADKRNMFTLTHAKFTHIKKFNNYSSLLNYKEKIKKKYISQARKNMENDISHYFPSFKKTFSYYSFFLSYKVLPDESSDKRSITIKQDKNLISCTSPKIANIFSFQDYVDKAIKKFK